MYSTSNIFSISMRLALVLVIFLGLMALIVIFGLAYTYIARDIIKLYGVPYLIDFTYVQLYGLYLFIRIVSYKGVSDKTEDDENESFAKFSRSLGSSLMTFLGAFLAWGMAYIIHSIIT